METKLSMRSISKYSFFKYSGVDQVNYNIKKKTITDTMIHTFSLNSLYVLVFFELNQNLTP